MLPLYLRHSKDETPHCRLGCHLSPPLLNDPNTTRAATLSPLTSSFEGAVTFQTPVTGAVYYPPLASSSFSFSFFLLMYETRATRFLRVRHSGDMSQINCYKRGISPLIQQEFDREERTEAPLVQHLDGKYPKFLPPTRSVTFHMRTFLG